MLLEFGKEIKMMNYVEQRHEKLREQPGSNWLTGIIKINNMQQRIKKVITQKFDKTIQMNMNMNSI